VPSSGRLWVGSVAFVALIGAVGCTPSQPAGPSGTSNTSTTSTTSTTSAQLPPVASLAPTATEAAGHDTGDIPAPPTGQPGPVAAGFAAAWVRGDLPADRWWSAVAPFCEAGFAQRLRTVDPGNLPATKLTGAPVQVSPPVNGVAVFTITTDGGALVVTVAAGDGRWLVTDNDFQRAVR
jgi:hypothetical protein